MTVIETLRKASRPIAKFLGGDRFVSLVHAKLGGKGTPVRILNDDGKVIRGEIIGSDIPKGRLTVKPDDGQPPMTVPGRRVF